RRPELGATRFANPAQWRSPMTKLRTLGLPAFASIRDRKAEGAVDLGWLKMACIVSAFCVAAVMPAAGQGFTVIHNFWGSQTESGAQPLWALIQATGGNFYGNTNPRGGDSNTRGLIYKLTS